MDLSLFDYHLPQELIAQAPAMRRDGSRLLAVHRAENRLEDNRFRRILDYLRPGDVMVFNDTKVIPARLTGEKIPHGARIEMLLLERKGDAEWMVIAYRASRLKAGTRVRFSPGMECEVLEALDEGMFRVRFEWEGEWDAALERHGSIPLPPYIERANGEMADEDRERYQTVFARDGSLNSAAAPTAGLHFTPELIEDMRAKGVETARVTLRIGLDTFMPLRVERVEDHRMHTEAFFVPEKTAAAVTAAKREQRRVLAAGTTALRVLESAAGGDGALKPGGGTTGLYIYPGYRFRAVDALLTNFHLPRSSLLLLVSAFMGNGLRAMAYEHAVRERYRFYSYGDAMLIL